MPHLRSKHQALRDPCPDAENLCVLAEARMSGSKRGAIAAHTIECRDCRDLYVRLLEFARPPNRVPETEWVQAEKRLGNWMEAFLRTRVCPAAARLPVDAKKAAFAQRHWKRLGLSKLEWAAGLTATIAVTAAALTFFIAGSPLKEAGQVAENEPPPAEQKSAEEVQQPNALPASPAVPAETLGSQFGGAPAAPLSTTEVVPNTATSTPPRVAAPRRSEPAPPRNNFTRSAPTHSAVAAPAAAGPVVAPPALTSGPNITAAVLSPEVKQSIADEVQAELAAEKQAAAKPQSATVAGDHHIPAALEPHNRVFIVSRIVSAQRADGQECSLSPGDVLTRITDAPEVSLNVQVLVVTSQSGECSSGTKFAMSLQELQDMHNDFREKLESGLQSLAENRGKNGIPAGPAPGGHANADGVAAADKNAAIELQQQQIEADNTEDEVARAAEGVAPSAFHPSRQLPEDSASLRLAAWDRTIRQQSNSRPQHAPPAHAPAPSRPASPPPARPASPQPAPHPPAPARPAPTPKSMPAPGARPGPSARPATPTPKKAAPPFRPPTGAPAAAARGGEAGARNRAAAPSRFTPPRDAKAMPEGKGMKYTSSKGEFHTAPNGKLSALKTPSGTEAKFNSRGALASIHTVRGMTIHHAANGARRIETLRSDGTKIVSTGRNRGFVENSFTHGGRTFVARTYVVKGGAYARVYGRYSYRGEYFYHYVPAYYYAPAFYGWAYNPWAEPVAFGWDWGPAPWYGYYGYYFSPAAFYSSPALWLTDFLLAANLQAAYDAQASASNSFTPRDLSAANDFHAAVPPSDSGEFDADDLRTRFGAGQSPFAVWNCSRLHVLACEIA